MDNLPSIPPNISEITAPLLIGSLLNYAFYGVLMVQICIYHIAFPADVKRFKALVYIIFIVETAQVCMAAEDVYYWFAAGYGNMQHLGRIHFSSIIDPLLGSTTAFITQLFFCYRIWGLKKEAWWLSAFIACISVVQLVGGVTGGIIAYLAKTYENAIESMTYSYMWLFGNAAADLVIAATLTILLLQQRRQLLDQDWTNSVLMRLVRLVLETNCLTATLALISVVLFLAAQDKLYFLCPTKFLGKLYANSLLITLNNRIFFRHDVNRGQGVSAFEAAIPVHLKSMRTQTNSASSAQTNLKSRDTYGIA